MKIKYCLPIVKSSQAEVRETINTNLTQYSFFEIWLDYIDDLNTQFIQYLIKDYEDKLIFLFRRQKLDKIHMSLEKRKEIIVLLSEKDVLLDLDIMTQQEELSYIKEKGLSVSLIISHHDYEKTPETEKLQEIITIMKQYNPKIYKIATYCQTPSNALQLLSLLLRLRKQHIRCIMLGMGPHSTITRIFGTLWGNELIFAPLDKTEETAPGMLTYQQLENIFKQFINHNS